MGDIVVGPMVVTPLVAACVAVPLAICLVPPVAFATGACLIGTAVVGTALCAAIWYFR